MEILRIIPNQKRKKQSDGAKGFTDNKNSIEENEVIRGDSNSVIVRVERIFSTLKTNKFDRPHDTFILSMCKMNDYSRSEMFNFFREWYITFSNIHNNPDSIKIADFNKIYEEFGEKLEVILGDFQKDIINSGDYSGIKTIRKLPAIENYI